MYNIRSQPLPGMQVHAVPEAERHIDSTGRKLPWGYESSAGLDAERRETFERGPFGKSTGTRRARSGASRSRSKTAEPRREEDRIRAENTAAEDAVFGTLRRIGTKEDVKREALGEIEQNSAGQLAGGRGANGDSDSEPTEVLLYGFGEDLQWSAIDFYERVSNGCILEDYDRVPAGTRYDVSRTLGRATAQKSLSRAAMRKKNKYAGGGHWIKVTFDSRQAADLALARSPHTIKGYLVYASYYQGRGPAKDQGILATQAGAQITTDVLPPTFSTLQPNASPSPSSATASSATATAPSNGRLPPPWNAPLGIAQDSPTASSSTLNGNMTQRAPANGPATQSSSSITQQQMTGRELRPRRPRIEGATRVVLQPAELALAPRQPKPSWTSWIGASEMIGSAVPRKQDGSFHWDAASFYWRVFYILDHLLGTDFCGLKMDE